MNLNEIQANIRLRNPWEAVDLGFSMVQTWWKSIYIPLAILTFGIAVPLFLIIPKEDVWIASIIIWWLKPLYDRLVLHIISHKLFNEELSSWQALKTIPSLIWNTGFFQSITFRRFSFSRGFNLPLWQLEQLRGEPRTSRQNILHIASHSQAIWLTVGLWFLELILCLSLFVLLFLFLPENIQDDFFDNIFKKAIDYAIWVDILIFSFYVLVITAIHPFYIAGNFALYINRRTQLEAWDIELDFRKLANRLKQASQNTILTLFLLIFTAVILSSPTQTFANDLLLSSGEIEESKGEYLHTSRLDSDKSREVIDEVMLTENLNDKETTHRWVKKKKEKDEEENDIDLEFWDKLKRFLEPTAKVFGFIIEFGLWILLALGIGFLIYYRERWMYLFKGEYKAKADYESPDVMFGMDIRPESLPNNIVDEARKLWLSKQPRESLGLLYRGALVRLINKEKVKLQSSHTEGDVLKLSSNKLVEPKQRYLKFLTKQWRLIAYAHRSPSESDMQNLFDHWASDFAFDTNQESNMKGKNNEQ